MFMSYRLTSMPKSYRISSCSNSVLYPTDCTEGAQCQSGAKGEKPHYHCLLQLFHSNPATMSIGEIAAAKQ